MQCLLRHCFRAVRRTWNALYLTCTLIERRRRYLRLGGGHRGSTEAGDSRAVPIDFFSAPLGIC